MLDDVDPYRTSEDDDDTSKDLMTFCLQLVHHSQWKTTRAFSCGSCVDIPLHQIIGQKFELNKDILDIDRMIYNTNHYAAHQSATLPESYTGGIVRINTDDVHTGYVRLIREKDNAELRLSDLYQLTSEIMHGPAVLSDGKMMILKNNYTLSNPYADIARLQAIKVTSLDVVCSIHTPYWPVEATEWVIRRRPRGFLSKSVVKKVVRYGCDFVQVSHSRLRNDNDWRFSFSHAELLITKSWSTSQRVVYTGLWVLNKMSWKSNSYLCSYYFKTLMF